MKVASFNANSIRARLGIITDWLEAERPDVLCIQETKVQDKDFPIEAIKEAGYYPVYCGEKSYNGVAVLGSSEPESVCVGFNGSGGNEAARLIRAVVCGVVVVNTYAPQGFHPLSEKFSYKLEWFARLKRYFEENFKPTDKLLWVGDFNVAPDDRDVYDPVGLSGEVGFHPKEKSALEEVRRWGFVDVFREHVTEGGHYTFWDYRIRGGVRGGRGWRIDHIWATTPLAKMCSRAWIDVGPRLRPKPSDHTFIAAEFDIEC